MNIEKKYKCIKGFSVESCDGDGCSLDDSDPIIVEQGSIWYWNSSIPDYLWMDSKRECSFLINIDPSDRDSEYFELLEDK